MADRIDVPIARFAFTGKGNYVSKPDRRDLFQILHPWSVSKAGDFGQMEAQVALPADAKPPFTLSFYVMDNNYTGPENTGADWINRDVRVGHRFRQALVNGEVVWQEDTCLDDVSRHTLVDVTEKVKPGETFRLAFRLWEAADSSVTLPGDVYITEHYASKVAYATKQVIKDRYETKSYWGDVAVYSGGKPKPEEIPWGWQTVLKAPRPELPKAKPAARETAALAVEQAELLQGPWPWPVQQGIPFSMGALDAPARTALKGPDGKALPAEVRRLNAWPDGSVQWALASFTLPPRAAGACSLLAGRQVRPAASRPAHPVSATDALSCANGLVSLKAPVLPGAAPTTGGADAGTRAPAGGERGAAAGDTGGTPKPAAGAAGVAPAAGAAARAAGGAAPAAGDAAGTAPAAGVPTGAFTVAGAAGRPVVRCLAPYLRAGGQEYVAHWTEARWLQRSPLASEMALAGDLSAPDGSRYGTCRLRLALFADCPYVRLLFTITNQRPEKTFSTEAYGLRIATAGAKQRAAEGGWVSVDTEGGALTAAVRWFAHLWPNGILVTPEGIDVQCFKSGDERLPAYNTHPGEAKTQEIWLAVTPAAPSVDDCRKLAALVETPPRLDVSARIRESGVWGEMPQITARRHPEVYAKVGEVLAPYFEKCKEGTRLFGEYGNWDNYYWNTLHTLYSLYAMTGERRWWDWAERSVRHHFDVDICHWQPETDAVGVVGAMHGYWGDHSDTPCHSLIQNCDGAFDHWNLTGDPDGFAFGAGIAEYVRGSQHIGRGGSSREQGWPITCMLAAWRQTGEAKYGEHAKLLVETALGFEERRRGTYIEVHGSVSYLGPTPFMYGILCTALRKYHLRTGDERAAILIARLANAVYEEAHDPFHSKTLPNIDYYYSPNPYLRGGDGFTPITTLNLNIASAQAYGAYVTQDAGLADIARRSWLAGLNGGTVYAEMAYDLAGVVWWLERLEGMPAGR